MGDSDEAGATHPSAAEDFEHDLVLAITNVLGRACLGRSRAGDRDLAVALLTELHRPYVERTIRAAAAGGITAAFTPERLTERKLVLTVRISARSLCTTNQPEQRVLLGALVIALMAQAGHADDKGADFLAASTALRRVEQHDLSAWSARRAIATGRLTDEETANAWQLVALATSDPDAHARASTAAALLPVDSPARRWVESTTPVRTASGDASGAPLRDRREAARRVLGDLAEIAGQGYEDDMLTGLRLAMEAYAAPELDLPAARKGLLTALRHWRSRRGLGQVPRAATAGLEVALDLLLVDGSSNAVVLMCELFEALVDAGLVPGDVQWATGGTAPSVLQAALSRRAARRPTWPDLADLLASADGSDFLLLHPRHDRHGVVVDVTSLYLRSPAGFSLRRARLDELDRQTMRAFCGGSLADLSMVSSERLDRLVTGIVAEHVAEFVGRSDSRELIIVPMGRLAAVPWTSADVHGHSWAAAPVVVAPSMSVAGALSRPGKGWMTVHTLVDTRLPGAAHLLAELRGPVVRHGGLDTLPSHPEPGDVLLIFAHGSGQGLEYRLHLPGGSVGMSDLVHTPLPRRAVIAACRSGGPAPTAFPLAVPTVLMLAGVSTVVAGLWPLPSETTAGILSEALRTPADSLSHAVRGAIHRNGREPVVDGLGLAVFGRDDG
ncbi:CHAT domain-containing protein [Streptomyces neyagawaensis]|uniref:CHAT domain-containing protein n=1 Tax=Streptomyces neyagawaensis TaxID=42238 RepID=A0ABV3B5M4_9ACTN